MPVEILAHRVIWSLFVCLGALTLRRQLGALWQMLRTRRLVGWLTLAAIGLSLNWGIFIWAINSGHVVESALGYYINPLIMIASGVLFLGERMRRTQWIAVGLGVISVIILTAEYGRPPYIALALAFSWGFYALVKKHLSEGALETLTVETLLMFAPAAMYLIVLGNRGDGRFGSSAPLTLLLITAGFVTAIPLLMFNGAATRVPLSTMGLLQYLNPTIQFVIGLSLRHETMSGGRWIGFTLIWLALVLLSVDGLRSSRAINDNIAESH